MAGRAGRGRGRVVKTPPRNRDAGATPLNRDTALPTDRPADGANAGGGDAPTRGDRRDDDTRYRALKPIYTAAGRQPAGSTLTAADLADADTRALIRAGVLRRA